MITTVLFDMGGTLEDIWVDEESHELAIAQLDRMLKSWGMDPGLSLEALRESAELRKAVEAGWKRYDTVRTAGDVELKPTQIWGDYILTDFDFPREALLPRCEEIAHMWEVTYFHRRLRPRVREMLGELKKMGLKDIFASQDHLKRALYFSVLHQFQHFVILIQHYIAQ